MKRALLSFGICLCSCARLELPEGPDLDELEADYDDPQGVVEDATMEAVADVAVRHFDAILALGQLDFVIESLDEVAEVVKEAARGEADTPIRISALTSVDKICPGDADDDPNPEDGQLEYTLRIKENAVLDTIWGRFQNCRFVDPGEIFPGVSELPRAPGALVTYDGSMDIHLGGVLHLAELALETFLFRMDGHLQFQNETVDVALDFRVHRDSRTDVRVPAAGGDVIFAFRPQGRTVGLETGAGSYCCDFSERACVRSTGNDCEDLLVGDRVLRW